MVGLDGDSATTTGGSIAAATAEHSALALAHTNIIDVVAKRMFGKRDWIVVI